MKKLLYMVWLMVSSHSYCQTQVDTTTDEKKKIKREQLLKEMQERSDRAKQKLNKSRANDTITNSRKSDKELFDSVFERYGIIKKNDTINTKS